jgi:hypothetical protein
MTFERGLDYCLTMSVTHATALDREAHPTGRSTANLELCHSVFPVITFLKQGWLLRDSATLVVFGCERTLGGMRMRRVHRA